MEVGTQGLVPCGVRESSVCVGVFDRQFLEDSIHRWRSKGPCLNCTINSFLLFQELGNALFINEAWQSSWIDNDSVEVGAHIGFQLANNQLSKKLEAAGCENEEAETNGEHHRCLDVSALMGLHVLGNHRLQLSVSAADAHLNVEKDGLKVRLQ